MHSAETKNRSTKARKTKNNVRQSLEHSSRYHATGVASRPPISGESAA